MIATLIGLGVSAVTTGVKKAVSKKEQIYAEIDAKKLSELSEAGLLVTPEQVAINEKKRKNLLMYGLALIAALYLIFRK
ncbi:MAG: hypothetical protein ACTHMM_13430 [Agriterribacter sp.]